VAFWDLSSGECTRNLDVSCLNPGANTRLHLSGDGCRLIVDSDAINSPVYIFDVKTGQLLHRYNVSHLFSIALSLRMTSKACRAKYTVFQKISPHSCLRYNFFDRKMMLIIFG